MSGILGMKWGARREKPDTTVLYICDPALNVECFKRSCHCNGGPCYHTTTKDFAYDIMTYSMYYSKDGETFVQVENSFNAIDELGRILGDDYEYVY